jgi:hypothetical protein
MRADSERDVIAMCAHRGEMRIAEEWAEGQDMTEEQAITYTLQTRLFGRRSDAATR